MGFMAGHLMSTLVSGFHIGDGTNIKPAHFWSQGPLVNGVRSWQLIIKHDLVHRFHGQTLVCPPQCPGSTSVSAPMWNGPLLEPGSNCEYCQKLAIDYKTLFDTSVSWLDNWCPPQFPGSTPVRAPMLNWSTSGVRVHL